MRRISIPVVLIAVLLSACTPSEPPLPDVSPAATTVASALTTGDWSGVTFSGSADDAVKDYGIIVAGLNGLRPSTVGVGGIVYDKTARTATASLTQTYPTPTPWVFTNPVSLRYDDARGWLVDWSPGIVHLSLTGYTRLSLSTYNPTRGEIRGRDGQAIVFNRQIYNVGIDKTKVSGDAAIASAKQLAQVLGINVDNYVTRVTNGGPKQFVIAQTLRAGQVPPAVETIPGVLLQGGTLPLGPTPTFAIGVLGTAGLATAEDIQKSGGRVEEGDIIGKSGLQASQNSVLGGTDGVSIFLVSRAAGDIMATPATTPASASPAATGTPSTTGTPGTVRVALFHCDPVPGQNITITLDADLQTKAESILAGQAEIASMVVLDVHSGAILVAANSPAAGQNAYATNGRYAPGSSFKVTTALALVRSGMTPDSKINCPTSVTVNGATFGNVTGYSPAHNGTITLRQAVAYSCNTAMINGSLTLGNGDIAAAAASLGLGVQHQLGFNAFLGSVPVPNNDVDKAASAFGMGKVLMSPLAMATEAASVGAGHTIVPYLLTDATGNPWQPPATPDASDSSSGAPSDGPSDTPSGGPVAETPSTDSPSVTPSVTTPPTPPAPLTDTEVTALRDVMKAVIDIGSGTILRGLALGAKTGTAQFMQDGQMLTHTWMVAYTDKYAICAWVNVGAAGATTSGPLIKAFLTP